MAEHKVEVAEQKFLELKKFEKDGNVMFALADYYASQCEYEKAIQYYDFSFELDKENGAKPLYTDAIEGMAMIYEIQEKYEDAIKCYDRILEVLAEAFGYTEGALVDEVNVEKQRVIELVPFRNCVSAKKNVEYRQMGWQFPFFKLLPSYFFTKFPFL